MLRAEQPAAESGLEAIDVCRVATDGTRLLDHASIAVVPGDRVALTGRSGSGKSLLLRALVLLDPLNDGRVEWQGAPVKASLMPAFRRQVLYLQQRPLVTEGNVASQLELPWTFESAEGLRFEPDRARKLLARAGRTPDFLKQSAENLSGGEAQLVALVRALLIEPRALLLDEPTSAMDGATREAAESLLEEWIQGDPDRAWLWASHDSGQLARLCHRRVTVEAGRVGA